jgi:hypothetical protein
MIETDRVYTLAEAAILMRTPYRVARDAVFSGRWPHVKVSPRKRFMTGADIRAALDLMRQAPKASEPVDVRGRKDRIKHLLAS